MDKGAHFYNCDFQVHSPRDLNWHGRGAITDGERKQYADEFIQACRHKNLNAVAITDHHDFAFYPYIRAASESELDDLGDPIPENKRIIVYPGLELTLASPPCQALLLLDADFPTNLLSQILTILNIDSNPPEDEKHAKVVNIPRTTIYGLENLYDIMNNREFLKGRFVVLPNVNDGGNCTILRSRFADYYKNMPCVGGYLDGSITQLGDGNKKIIAGEDRSYGFKTIAVIQTSDNRNRNFSDLGKHTTWIKWSKPTAEALRQACLAKESRISQEDPDIPNIYLISVKISNSKFLGPFEIEFNPQYNAIIGGRGTGKSTILEYIRWGLCDQPMNIEMDEELATIQNRRKNLIEKTLQRFEGEVKVSFLVNNILHIVKRNSSTHELQLRIGDGEYEVCKEDDIRNLLPIQAYSQKQLSNVGVRIEELKRFIELPIRKKLEKIKFSIEEVSVNMQNVYRYFMRKKAVEHEIEKHNIEMKSLNTQANNLRKKLKGISEEDRKIIEQKESYDNEELLISNWKEEIESFHLKLVELKKTVKGSPQKIESESKIVNKENIQEIYNKMAGKYKKAVESITELEEVLKSKKSEKLDKLINEWESVKEQYDKKYEGAKNKSKSNRKQLAEIKKIEDRLLEINKELSERKKDLEQLGEPEREYKKYREEWLNDQNTRIELLKEQINRFNSLSGDLIRTDSEKGVNTNRIKEKLKQEFTGMRVNEQKINEIGRIIIESGDALKKWEEILVELEKLAYYEKDEQISSDYPETTILLKCGLKNEISRIAEKLNPEKWLSISITEIEFNPFFLYTISKKEKEFINFSDASAGQQATALLTVLLNQEGAPLIMDQPEDDIDNRVMESITNQIWKSKRNRQLIFTSHNANLVVNGDAELVICCDYRVAGDQSGGQIKHEGAIDSEDIRKEITTVMEGGEKAFKLRKEKYGF